MHRITYFKRLIQSICNVLMQERKKLSIFLIFDLKWDYQIFVCPYSFDCFDRPNTPCVARAVLQTAS